MCDAESPWQNGRCERHGGLIKEAAARALTMDLVTTLEDFEGLVYGLTAAKNRLWHRGGYSPCQLVLGQNPR
eukprot:9656021-Lingulodinium_polyedra.AAC.1